MTETNSRQSKVIDKRTEIVEMMKKFVKDGAIDITAFRLKHPSEYAMLPYYFGTVANAVEDNGWVKAGRTKNKDGMERAFLRDQLAFYALKELRKKHTLDVIGGMFGGVSRQGVNQLYKVLEKEMAAAAAKKPDKE